MRHLVLVCNIVSLAFTLLVIGTDGLPTQASYIALTLLLVIIPIFTILALARPGSMFGSGTTTLRFAAISNLVLLGFVGWALVDQHPHPNEPGFVPYAVLMILTPFLSAVALFRYKPNQATPRSLAAPVSSSRGRRPSPLPRVQDNSGNPGHR